MKTKQADQIWVVVDVRSGVPVEAEAFAERNVAKRRQQKLRRQMRQDYDEIGLFEVTIKR